MKLVQYHNVEKTGRCGYKLRVLCSAGGCNDGEPAGALRCGVGDLGGEQKLRGWIT